METKEKQKEYQWVLDLKNDELVYITVQYITATSRISKQKQENRDKLIEEILK